MTETRLARRPSETLGAAWNPLARFERLFGDSLLRPFFADGFESMGPRSWVPAADVWETDGAYVLTMDLPGFAKDSVDVTLESHVLTVSGERRPVEEAGRRIHRVERGYGRFSRSFTLPSQVEADKVKARFQHGVLTLTVPKAETAKARRILVH